MLILGCFLWVMGAFLAQCAYNEEFSFPDVDAGLFDDFGDCVEAYGVVNTPFSGHVISGFLQSPEQVFIHDVEHDEGGVVDDGTRAQNNIFECMDGLQILPGFPFMSELSVLAQSRYQRYKEIELLCQTLTKASDFDVKVASEYFRRLPQKKILCALNKRRGEWFAVHDLLDLAGVDYKKRSGTILYLARIIGLVLDGVPVSYDKSTQKVMLLPEKKNVKSIEKGANIFTLTYRLLQKYGKNIFTEEMAYYGHDLGYWDAGFRWHEGVKKNFFNYFDKSKLFLVLLGFVDKSVMDARVMKKMTARMCLWERVKKDRQVFGVDYYNARGEHNVTQEDLGVINSLLIFTQTSTYLDFEQHTTAQGEYPMTKSRADFIELLRKALGKNALSKDKLESFFYMHCRGCWADFWDFVQEAMCFNGEGHLAYNLNTKEFCWDNKGCKPPEKKEGFVVELFSLKTDYPIEETNLLGIILEQRGFAGVTNVSIRNVLRGLTFLGLYYQRDHKPDQLAKVRKLLNCMVSMKVWSHTGMPAQQITNLKEWELSTCDRVALWVKGGIFPVLWQTFLSKKAQMQEVCSGDDVISAKRRKMEGALSSVEGVLRVELPALLDYLPH